MAMTYCTECSGHGTFTPGRMGRMCPTCLGTGVMTEKEAVSRAVAKAPGRRLHGPAAKAEALKLAAEWRRDGKRNGALGWVRYAKHCEGSPLP